MEEENIETPVEGVDPTPAPVPAPVEEEEADEPKTVGGPTVRGPAQEILVVTDLGFGSRTSLSEFRISHRGTKGNKTMTLNEKNGNIIGVKCVKEGDVVFLVTKKGQGAIIPIDALSLKARGRFGVRLMKVDEGDSVIAVC